MSPAVRTLDYLNFNEVNPQDFLPILNSQKIRKHLVAHALFTPDSITTWIKAKIAIDAAQGCRVRAIVCEGELLGWCGIQKEDGQYAIAIIIDDKVWGLGKQVFKHMLCWAKELGHEKVCINFLHTRPAYQFLNKMAQAVYETQLFGSKFTSYQLRVK